METKEVKTAEEAFSADLTNRIVIALRNSVAFKCEPSESTWEDLRHDWEEFIFDSICEFANDLQNENAELKKENEELRRKLEDVIDKVERELKGWNNEPTDGEWEPTNAFIRGGRCSVNEISEYIKKHTNGR